MRAILLILIVAVVALIAAIATGLIDISQTRGARAPHVEASNGAIRAQGGQSPAFEVQTGSVADRDRVGYRLRVTNSGGVFLVEQQAYFGVESDRITWLRILCSGYRKIDD